MDSLTLAISQGSLRRGSAACYLDIFHPEIEEFLEIRKAGRRLQPQELNLHHGINITDEFMEAVRDDTDSPFQLKSPKSGEVLKEGFGPQAVAEDSRTAPATGEPYLIFSDTVNKRCRRTRNRSGLKVRQSNLCSEIMLHTGIDHLGRDRTAVCCLSSVNAEKFLEWKSTSRNSSRTCSASSTTC
jgi:ribonucleoside-diphosphate reductase alpha chain